MAHRVKIFKMDKDPRALEGELNQWLTRKPGIDIVHVASVDYRDSASTLQSILMVIYGGGHRESDESDSAHRRHERIYLHEIVDYSIDSGYYRDFIQNISESGLFIRSSRSFPVGKDVTMTLMAPGNDRAVKLKGVVVRSLPDGFGVEFRKESQVQDAVIRSLVENFQRRPSA